MPLSAQLRRGEALVYKTPRGRDGVRWFLRERACMGHFQAPAQIISAFETYRRLALVLTHTAITRHVEVICMRIFLEQTF
jgi:hypothetical protein